LLSQFATILGVVAVNDLLYLGKLASMLQLSVRLWVCACLVTIAATAQEAAPDWTVRGGGGLGVGIASMPRLADYASVVAASSKPVDEFASVAELSAFVELRLSGIWSAGVSWGRVAKTLEPEGLSGWTFDATMTMPMLFARRSVEAGGMRLLLTAGAGPVEGELMQRYGALGSEQRYEGSGVGLLAGAAAFAPLDDHIVAGIAADVRWSGVGRLQSDAGLPPTHRGVTADLRWTQLSLQFLIAAQW
jgi:hypothetical protein